MPGEFDPYRTWLGIPPEEQPPNHYRLLGIPLFEDQPEAIEHAADRQMAHLRTLQTGEHAALSQRLLNEVAAARICLLNPDKKAAYDAQLRRQLQPQPAPARKPPVVAQAAGAPKAGPAEQETADWTALGQLGEYRLLEKLGAGGMGEVYKAVHTEMDRVVAVKVLPPGHLQDEHAVARFKREIKSIAKLDHPNIVRALDARDVEGTLFLVMEYVDGLDLRDVAKRLGPLPVADACEIVRQAALGLQCAHEHGLVHRDIKPSNLMLSAPLSLKGRGAGGEGVQPVVRLLDLGLARAQIEQGEEEELTGTGEAMGTADYMAPEQAADSRSVDIRADLYSLGCTLYRLLAGRPPFSGSKYDTAVKKLMAHIQHPVPPIAKFRPDVPKPLQIILGRLLAKDPAKRLHTPAEVAKALVPLTLQSDLQGLYARAAGLPPKAAPPARHQATMAAQESQSTGLTRFLKKMKRGGPAAAPAASVPASHKKGFPPYLGYVAVAAVALLLAVALGVVLATRSSDEEPVVKRPSAERGDSRVKKSQAAKTQWLVLQWPADQREDATLEIDRWPRKIADLVDAKDPDQLKMEVTPGVHKVWIARRGFEPYEQTVKVEPGKELVIRPEWGKPPEVAVVPPAKPEEKPPEKPEKPKPKDVAVEKPEPKEKPKPPEIDPALKRRQELDAKYAQALEPIEALVAKWDFTGAVAALAKIEFEEPELMARRNARGREIQRLVALKARIIARVNAAQPPLRKSALMIKGMNGDVVKADDAGITTKLASGKTESFAWDEIGTKAPQRLVALVVDRQKPDDWLAGGLLALASGDADSAEDSFAKARELGADIGPYLAPLAAAAFAKAEGLLDKKDFTKAEAALAALEQKYGTIPWLKDNTASFDAARTAAKTGIAEAEAERLYAEAVDLFNKKELFDVRPLVQKLKSDYPQTPAVTDPSRKPPFADLDKAVANLGKMFTVRLDGKGDFKTIQAAIDAAPANSLIEIQDNGPYNERIEITQQGLTLRGKKGCWPIVTSTGQHSRFAVLVWIKGSSISLERMVLAHSTPRGTDSICVQVDPGASVRIQSSVLDVWGQSRSIGVHGGANCDCCVFTNTVFPAGASAGAIRNSILVGGELRASGCTLENCVVKQRMISSGPWQIRFCTIPGVVTLQSDRDVITDSIIGQVESPKRGHRIESCDLYGNPPLMDRAEAGKGCFRADPQFVNPKMFDYRLMPTSPCRGKASDGGDVGCRYTPEMIEILQVALELRRRGIIKF